jgi:hypothetical protein
MQNVACRTTEEKLAQATLRVSTLNRSKKACPVPKGIPLEEVRKQ